MKRNITLTLLAMAVLMICANCTSQRDKDLNAILSYEATIDFATAKVDISTGETLVKMYVGFATDYPTDSLAPMYLMKAADVAMNIKRGDIAIKYLDRLIKDYPNYDKLPDCYFMRGYVYETVLTDVNKAKEAYELFLMQYPNHPLAADIRTIIQNLSLSDEEIIKMIMEKNMAQ
jgi:outer membrane protein assembly factor BamD (BamD/ComL family)